jgi:hypothetical protein
MVVPVEDKEGMQKIEQYASWLDRDWPSAASLREGLEEMFAINCLSSPLRKSGNSTSMY